MRPGPRSECAMRPLSRKQVHPSPRCARSAVWSLSSRALPRSHTTTAGDSARATSTFWSECARRSSPADSPTPPSAPACGVPPCSPAHFTRWPPAVRRDYDRPDRARRRAVDVARRHRGARRAVRRAACRQGAPRLRRDTSEIGARCDRDEAGVHSRPRALQVSQQLWRMIQNALQGTVMGGSEVYRPPGRPPATLYMAGGVNKTTSNGDAATTEKS